MIYKLRKKFIKICTLSFLAVFVVLFSVIYLLSSLQTDRSLDTLTDVIAANGGRFPISEPFPPKQGRPLPPNRLDEETPFRTRFFSVRLDADGAVIFVDTKAIISVDQSNAIAYATAALEKDRERGWIEEFRYKICDTSYGKEIVFVNGAVERASGRGFLMTTLSVFGVGSLAVLLLIILSSKWAVKPSAESYAKQKQFITDANHELKTPLTLIRTNLEIIKEENGSNEWLADIDSEVERMTDLVEHLVALARMDEEQEKPVFSVFDLSRAVDETVDIFASSVTGTGKNLSVTIPENMMYNGDESAIRQLVSILMDNAVKYCDVGGSICVTLHNERHPSLTVDNSYAAVDHLELPRLFDRFYRADKARTRGGFGIGLSMAKAIVEKHRGRITAQDLGNGTIRFQVKL